MLHLLVNTVIIASLRALGDDEEEDDDDDLDMDDVDDDAAGDDAAPPPGAAPAVDPLQAKKEKETQDKKVLEDRCVKPFRVQLV